MEMITLINTKSYPVCFLAFFIYNPNFQDLVHTYVEQAYVYYNKLLQAV